MTLHDKTPLKSDQYSRGEYFLIVGLVFFASVMVASLIIQNPNMSKDGLHYLLPIHNLLSGQGYTVDQIPEVLMPPGYGILAYGFFFIVRDIELSGMLMSAICYLLLVPLIYIAARFLFGKKCAFLAAFFVAFSPALIANSYAVLSDVPFSFFYISSFYLYARILLDRDRPAMYALLGGSLGFAYLIRPEAFLIAVLAFVSLPMLGLVKRAGQESAGGAASRRLPYIIAAAIAFLLIASPYIWFIHKHTGAWTFSTKTTYNLLIGEYIEEGQAHLDNLRLEHPEMFQPNYRIGVLEYARSRGAKFALRIKRNIMTESYALVRLTFHALVPLAFIGLALPFLSAKRRLFNNAASRRNLLIVLCFAIFLIPLLAFTLFFILDRFILPYSLLLLILFAFFQAQLWSKLTESPRLQRYLNHGIVFSCLISLLSVSGFTGFNAIPSLYGTLTSRHQQLGCRAAGLWLNRNVQVDQDLVLVSPLKGSILMFYVYGMQENFHNNAMTITSKMSLEEAANIVASGDADYLVLDNHFTFNRPQLLPLWNDPATADKYKLILVHQDADGLFQIYGDADDRP